jgi:hypothetical protein
VTNVQHTSIFAEKVYPSEAFEVSTVWDLNSSLI